MRIIVLGSGTSQGIPIIGCKCRTCLSDNPKDKRLRVSLYLVIDNLNDSDSLKLLIDTSPDFRQQMLINNLNDVDAVLFTHSHIDHIMGLDDIRQINQLHKKTVEIYGNEDTINRIKTTFSYVFDSNVYKGGGIPEITAHIINLGKFEIKGVEVMPIKYYHGSMEVWGYRIYDFAYLTDCSKIPEAESSKLHNLKVLIIDALRYKRHPTHFSISEAIEVAKKIGAEKTYFTHINHDVLHNEANSLLPEGMELSYDGLIIEI